ncbi:helix-turn-helix domain-containing protein [Burkholderia multivorans]|uniref:helix-turn-helix domain-containing protein n=1 Tax=Burkholderia multivorans TaxID=87883 RepID=UPI001C979D1D|nr:helix-turn-helix transcriptional regulator [Burkholderia multivorans]MBY4673895.1 helix-turn-helix domain-containing protein [Burkholderia multivorans]
MRRYNQAFGKAIRALRKAGGTTQEGLALGARISPNYISLLERGERSPTLDTMLAICHALDVTLVDLATAIEAELMADCHEATRR